jgi:O-antigen ligase
LNHGRNLYTAVRNPLDSASLQLLGSVLLRLGLGVGLAITLFAAWKSVTLLLVFLALLGLALGAWWLFRRPVLNLCTLIVGFALIVGFEDGTQPTEILYGLYYLAFLAHWFGTRLFLYRERIFETRESRVLILFLTLASLSVFLTLLYKGDLRFFIGEWLSLSFLVFYFPVKEVVVRYRHGAAAVMAALFVLAFFVIVRNFFDYQQILLEAAYAWQVTRGRAVTNTAVIMVPLFAGLIYFLHARTWRQAVGPALIFGIFFAGLIVSQSRGYWLAFGAACLILLFVMPGRQSRRLVGTGLISMAAVVGVGYLVLGDVFMLVATGLLDRVLSIGSAASQDISLINRFRESVVVFHKVLGNPILGHGMGVPFQFYDLTYVPPFTNVTTFLHNGYLALWYKFGIWGLGMVLYFWGSVIANALAVYRSPARPFLRYACLAVAAVLISLVISAITSNPFYINDPMFMFGVVAGVAAGARQLADREARDGLAFPA